MIILGKRLDKFNKIQIVAILFFFCIVVYFNTISNPFVHDDVLFIQKNPHVSQLSLQKIFSSPSQFTGKSDIANSYFRPLLDLYYHMQVKLFGNSPRSFHFFNILIHFFNGILVFLILEYFFEKRKYALIGSIFFLIHPVQSEAVASIVGISNLMYAFFLLFSFYMYLLVKKTSGVKRKFCYFGAIMFFMLSLFSKEQAVVLPFMVLVYEVACCWYEKKSGSLSIAEKTSVSLLSNLFFILVLYLFVRKIVVGSSISQSGLFNSELGLRLLSIPRAFLLYIRLLLFPVDLHYYRNIDILKPFLMPTLVFSSVVSLCVATVMSFDEKKKKVLAVFGLLWFVLSLAPVLNIVPIVNEFSFVLAADHFLYLPIVGSIIFLCVLFEDLSHRNYKFKGCVLYILYGLILISSLITMRLNKYWKSEIDLFRRTVKYEQDFGRGYMLLGKAYYFAGQYHQASSMYKKALKIMLVYVDKSKSIKAKKVYLDYVKEINFDLGYSSFHLRDNNKALHYFKRAAKVDPSDGSLHNNIGITYIYLNNADKAIFHFKKAFEMNKDDLQAKKNLIAAYMKYGRKHEAQKLIDSLNRVK